MRRILIVDDEEVVQSVLGRSLTQADRDLVIAGNVEVALDQIRCGSFDLLISDLRLPDGNGLAVIRAFRQRFKDARILAMTGSLTPDSFLEEAKGLGMDDCLFKPFDVKTMRSAVARMLGDCP